MDLFTEKEAICPLQGYSSAAPAVVGCPPRHVLVCMRSSSAEPVLSYLPIFKCTQFPTIFLIRNA